MKNKIMLRIKLFFIFLFFFLIFPLALWASSWTISPSSVNTNSSVEYCIGNVAPTTNPLEAGTFMDYYFAPGFDLVDLNISNTGSESEVTLYVGNKTCSASGADVRITEPTSTDDNNRDSASFLGEWIAHPVIDTVNGYAYIGTNTAPGRIIKIRLSDFTRVATLVLQPGDDWLDAAVIDTTNGYAYFATNNYPTAKIVKIRLSDFTRVGSLTLPDGENQLYTGVIDPANDFAYFTTAYTTPGKIVKIKLSDLSRVAVMDLDLSESWINASVIDTINGYAYFATFQAPSRIIKVKLSDFSRNDYEDLHSGDDDISSGVIDVANGFAYFGSLNTTPGRVVKVQLNPLAWSDSEDLSSGENGLLSGVIDTTNKFAYFSNYVAPGQTKIIKINLNPFGRDSALPLAGDDWISASIIDMANGFAYFTTNNNTPDKIIKIDLSDFSRDGDIKTKVDGLEIILEDGISGGTEYSLKFKDKVGSANVVMTPATAGNYMCTLKWGPISTYTFVDADSFLLPVGGANQVNILATVDPELTVTLSGTACNLGTFSATSLNTCGYNVTVNTNGNSGYSAYIKSDGKLRNATNDINDVTGGTVNDGTEAYGVDTSKASQAISRIQDVNTDTFYNADDCTALNGGTTHANASALTTGDQTFASASSPIANDLTYLCHAVSIAGVTPSGTYSQLVIITIIGNF